MYVADRFGGWQQLTNYWDSENESGASGGDILKKICVKVREITII